MSKNKRKTFEQQKSWAALMSITVLLSLTTQFME